MIYLAAYELGCIGLAADVQGYAQPQQGRASRLTRIALFVHCGV